MLECFESEEALGPATVDLFTYIGILYGAGIARLCLSRMRDRPGIGELGNRASVVIESSEPE
jgi:hypothetical protein